MARVRSGSVRERSTIYYAQVSFIDEVGKRQKVERQAETRKIAQQLIKEIARELLKLDGITVIDNRIRERRGGIFARITFTDENGKRHEEERRANNRTHAKEIIKQLLRELDDHGEQSLDAARMTFSDLSDYYKKYYLKPAEYIDGRKIAGQRSYRSRQTLLKYLKSYFGQCKLRSITHGSIEKYRAERLTTVTVRGSQRSITSVNRELQLMRRMFNIAQREGWIIKSPFAQSGSLISIADERKRERIITREEEVRLLAACSGKRAHIRPVVICALDTGMRCGEILKLKWADLDFESRIITVRAFNTKTMRERQVAMTTRLTEELQDLYNKSRKEVEDLVFGITDNFKKAFNTARNIARLPDVRFHDLRHTHATRLVAAHISLSEVGRVLGHTQANTTFRYVNANVETAWRAAAVLDEFNKPTNDRVTPVIN
jgi:integrase